MIDKRYFNFDQFREDVEDALKKVSKKYNLAIKAGNIRYDSTSIRLTIDCIEKVDGAQDLGEASWYQYYKYYGFNKNDYGKEVVVNGDKYKICGIKEGARCSILATRLRDSKTYGFVPEIIREALEEAKRGG